MTCPDMCFDFDYPQYETILDHLECICDWAEYSQGNHFDLKLIWENIHDTNMLKNIGERIYDRSGLTGKIASYHVFLHVMRGYLKLNKNCTWNLGIIINILLTKVLMVLVVIGGQDN